jgi:hypothetical protein
MTASVARMDNDTVDSRRFRRAQPNAHAAFARNRADWLTNDRG